MKAKTKPKKELSHPIGGLEWIQKLTSTLKLATNVKEQENKNMEVLLLQALYLNVQNQTRESILICLDHSKQCHPDKSLSCV